MMTYMKTLYNAQVLSWNDKGELKDQGETMPDVNITN